LTFGSKSASNVGAAGRSGPALPREFSFAAPLALDGAAQHGERATSSETATAVKPPRLAR